jgi:hypothetical protein
MENIKRILLIITIVLALVVIYFNVMLYLNYAVSLKYEVEHAEIIYDKDLSIRRQEIESLMDFSRLIFVFSFLTILTSISCLIKSKPKSLK